MRYLFGIFLLVASAALAQTPPASLVFDKDGVHEIRLKFAQTDYWEQLTTNYETNEDDVPYIEASLVWGETKLETVGVRFKGNSTYTGATTKKKPFRIKLNEFVKGQKIDGMASFSLSNAWNDPSFVREKAYYEMATAAGLKSPRSNFAALYINDEYWGLYVLTEVVNSDFLKSFFGKNDSGGNLYKADIGASFSYLGEDASAYKQYFEKQSNEEADDWTDLIELSKLIDQTPGAEYPAKIEPLIDIDSVLTALALDNLTVNMDSYVGMGQNFYIYRRPSDDKWVWIPWDPSLAFGAFTGQSLTLQQMKELALEYTGATGMGAGGGLPGGQVPTPGGGVPTPGGEVPTPGGEVPPTPGGGDTTTQAARPLATKLWQVPQYKQRYREIYRQMVEKSFDPTSVVARMNALREMIGPWVARDTQKLVTDQQYAQAMTAETVGGGGTGAPTTPTKPGGGGAFPGGDPGQNPGGGGVAGVGMTSGIPGLQPFIEGRRLAVDALLAGKTPLSATATPASITLAAIAGAAAASQTVALALSDAARTSSYRATSSANWLTVSPASGTMPGSLTVSAGGAGLAPGSYSGEITVASVGVTNTQMSIPVSLTVTSSASLVASPASLTFSSQSNPLIPTGTTATTQTIQVVSTNQATSFTATAASASCGSFFSVSPTSGTAPAAVTVSVNASGVTSGPCTGTVTLSAPGVAPATVQITLQAATTPVPNLPSITAIVNAASYATGAIAPGEIVTIFGTNLGGPTLVSGTFSGGKLATTLNGMRVTFDGVAAPIVYASSTQMSVIVPFEVAGKTQTTVQIEGMRAEGQAGLPQSVAAAAPGIFTIGSTGSGAALASPVSKGSTVAIYLTGAGQFDPTGSTGAVALAEPLQKIAAPVTATVGGQPATVVYAGAVPGSVQGLYQVNLEIPQAVSSGSVPLQLTIGGATTQSKVTLTIE